jgi:hypothetical protein
MKVEADKQTINLFRQLRLQEWKTVMENRNKAIFVTGMGKPVSSEIYNKKANTALRHVQALNIFFGIFDTAEKDLIKEAADISAGGIKIE